MSETLSGSPRRWMNSTKRKAGTEVWFGRNPDDLPYKKLAPLDSEIFAAYSGPEDGLCLVNPQLLDTKKGTDGIICGSKTWKKKNRKAYGISTSLYDQHPIKKIISGDPIADAFAVCARKNNSVLIIADGVNWGEKSMIAARCAVHGAAEYINQQLFGGDTTTQVKNTRDVFLLLLRSLEAAHKCILKHNGGLTTLCVALVLPTRLRSQYVVCIANVGDSLAYVFSKYHGVREITTGSHDIESERDIRDAGGAIGPVNGTDPELNNLTCSMTYVDVGDIVYLTTDGISDNYDPVVTKIAVANQLKPPKDEHIEIEDGDVCGNDGRKTEDNTGVSTNNHDTVTEDAISNETVQGSGGIERNGDKVQCEENTSQTESPVNNERLTNNEPDTTCDTVRSQDLTTNNNSSQHNVNNSLNQNCSEVNEGQHETTRAPVAPVINEVNKNTVTGTDNHNKVDTPPAREFETSQNMQIGKADNTLISPQRNISIRSGRGEKSSAIDIPGTRDSVERKTCEDVSDWSASDDDDTSCRVRDGKPEMTPNERHQYAVKEMEKVVLEFELMTEEQICAQELCGALLHHVLRLTNTKRNVLEDPNLYGKKLRPKDRKRRDSEIVARMSRAPGKLDHASIVGYEVGRYQGDADENYERSDAENDIYGSDESDSDEMCDKDAHNDVIVVPSDVINVVPVNLLPMDIPFIDDSDDSDKEQ